MRGGWKHRPSDTVSSGWEVALILFKSLVFLPLRIMKKVFGKDISIFQPVLYAVKKVFEATYTVYLCFFIFFMFIIVISLDIVPYFVLEPGDVYSQRVYTVVTHLFMHGSFVHVLGNIAVLFGVGRIVERYFGGQAMFSLFLFFGVGTGIVMSAAEVFITNGAVGASAAITGLSIVALLRNPLDLLFTPPVILPVVLVIPSFILSDILLLGLEDGVGREAHLVGALLGLLYTWFSTGFLFIVSRIVWVMSVFLVTLIVINVL